MTDKKIISLDYFNVNNKKNSILENAKYQDNDIAESFKDLESLTNKIEKDVLKKDKSNNVDTSVNFRKR